MKASLSKIQDLLLKKNPGIIEEARKELDTSQKQLKDLEIQCSMLEPAERSYYRPKWQNLRTDYDRLRKDFFQLEDQL